jgi:orotate phosphoribosyltransferase
MKKNESLILEKKGNDLYYTQTAEVTPGLLNNFGKFLEQEGLEYQEDAFKLRAGGESHWYFDARRAICDGWALKTVGSLAVMRAQLSDIDMSITAGMGIGGFAFAFGICWESRREFLWVNDKRDPTDRYGYGLHGPDVKNKKVFVADDTLSTGDSLITTTAMIRAEGGEVTDAMVIVDRSQGAAVTRMKHEYGVNVYKLFDFIEAEGRIVPA